MHRTNARDVAAFLPNNYRQGPGISNFSGRKRVSHDDEWRRAPCECPRADSESHVKGKRAYSYAEGAFGEIGQGALLK